MTVPFTEACIGQLLAGRMTSYYENHPVLAVNANEDARGGISLRLRTEDPQTVASECGTSPRMLSEHYAFAIEDSAATDHGVPLALNKQSHDRRETASSASEARDSARTGGKVLGCLRPTGDERGWRNRPNGAPSATGATKNCRATAAIMRASFLCAPGRHPWSRSASRCSDSPAQAFGDVSVLLVKRIR